MDQNNLQGGPFDSAQGKPQVPPPVQAPEVKLRTMESDIKSVETTGGSAPLPEFIPGPLLKPETQSETTVGKVSSSGGGLKKLFLWLFVLLVAGVVVGVGYFYVWPLFSNITSSNVPPQQPSGGSPVASVLSPTHTSHFGFSNDSLIKATLPDYSIVSIITTLQNAAGTSAKYGDLKEVFLNDSNGKPVTFSKYASALMPELSTSNLEATLKGAFEDDFTAYLYYDGKGVWPGYIVAMKPNSGIDMVTLNDKLKGLESSSFNNLFLSPPGDASSFRTGQVKDTYTDRFVPLSQPGASFNYGIFGNYLIINTSYEGLLKGLQLLGL